MPVITREEVENETEASDDILVVNVLHREDYEKEHIPGSVNVPHDAPDFLDQVKRKAAGKDQKIILYCAHADCPASKMAEDKLREAGYTNTAHYPGGMKEWKEKGGAVTTGAAAGTRDNLSAGMAS